MLKITKPKADQCRKPPRNEGLLEAVLTVSLTHGLTSETHVGDPLDRKFICSRFIRSWYGRHHKFLHRQRIDFA